MTERIFNIYIDESGDEGFTIKDNRWVSSKWFVVGALVVPKEHDLEVSRTVNKIKTILGQTSTKPLHFTNVSHDKKKLIIKKLLEARMFICSYVAFYKPQITHDSLLRTNKEFLYNYCIRFLLERLSWLVDDREGKMNLIFENRSNTSYSKLFEYIQELELDKAVQMRKDTIDKISTLNKAQSKNLQLADAITGSLYKALESNKFGDYESTYIEMLKNHIYHKNGNYSSYGLKFFKNPLESDEILSTYDWARLFSTKNVIDSVDGIVL